MRIQGDHSHLLLQSQSRNSLSDVGKGDNATSRIVDLVNGRSVSSSEKSAFEAKPAFRPVVDFVARYRTEDVYEQNEVLVTEDVTETRAVFEEREVTETRVTGTRDLSEFDSLKKAGIKDKDRFSVQVDEGDVAFVKFNNAEKITVKVGQDVQRFKFDANDGSFRDALLDALNSIDGLTASYTADGKLSLDAGDADYLTITNRRNDPLSRLGLAAGTTNATVVGYEQVQVGTEVVKTGERQTVVGTETVKVGTRQVADGFEQKIVGLERTDSFDTREGRFRSMTSDDVEMLFGQIRTESDPKPSLYSVDEVRSAYEETAADDWLTSDDNDEDTRSQSNEPTGWFDASKTD